MTPTTLTVGEDTTSKEDMWTSAAPSGRASSEHLEGCTFTVINHCLAALIILARRDQIHAAK